MAKKSKRRVYPMPKLSILDVLIYVFLIVFIPVIGLLSVILPVMYRDELSYADPDTIAYTTVNIFFAMPMGFWIMAIFIIVSKLFADRHPIFGRKYIKYGPPTYRPIYPLFTREKPKHWISPKQLNMKRNILIASFLGIIFSFIICILLYPGCIWNRSELKANGNLIRYNSYNSCIAEYSNDEITCVRLTTYSINRSSHQRKIIWLRPRTKNIKIVIETNDGHSAEFKLSSFRNDESDSRYLAQLKAMLFIKELYSDRFVVEDELYVSQIVSDLGLNTEETALLYELFQATS